MAAAARALDLVASIEQRTKGGVDTPEATADACREDSPNESSHDPHTLVPHSLYAKFHICDYVDAALAMIREALGRARESHQDRFSAGVPEPDMKRLNASCTASIAAPGSLPSEAVFL